LRIDEEISFCHKTASGFLQGSKPFRMNSRRIPSAADRNDNLEHISRKDAKGAKENGKFEARNPKLETNSKLSDFESRKQTLRSWRLGAMKILNFS
jgi:hypothetical protein